jgi:uncharacterized protein YqeY
VEKLEIMGLKDNINQQIKDSMKAGNKIRTGVLRMLLSEIKYAQSAVDMRTELAEEDTLKVVAAYFKKLEKSLDDFPDGDRRQAIRDEMEIVQEFLPKKASTADVVKVVDAILANAQEKNFGPLMKEVLAKLGSAADGKVVSQVLKARLEGKPVE